MEEISEKGTIQIIVCTVIHVILWHRNYLPIELKDCVFIMHINTGTCTDSKTTCIFFSSLKYVSWRLPQLWLKTWRHQHAHEHNIYVTQFEDFCPLHWSSHHSFPGTSWHTWKKNPHIWFCYYMYRVLWVQYFACMTQEETSTKCTLLDMLLCCYWKLTCT